MDCSRNRSSVRDVQQSTMAPHPRGKLTSIIIDGHVRTAGAKISRPKDVYFSDKEGHQLSQLFSPGRRTNTSAAGTTSRRTHHVDCSFPPLPRQSSPRPAQNKLRRLSLVQLPLWSLGFDGRRSKMFRLDDPRSCGGNFRGDFLLLLALRVQTPRHCQIITTNPPTCFGMVRGIMPFLLHGV